MFGFSPTLFALALAAQSGGGCLSASVVAEPLGPIVQEGHQHSALTEELQTIIQSVRRAYGLENTQLRVHFSSGRGSPAVHFPANHSVYLLVLPLETFERLKSRAGSDGLEFVIAHELAHVAALSTSSSLRSALASRSVSIRKIELFADMAAGHYHYDQNSSRGLTANSPVTRAVIALSDYEFSNPVHHGTVFDRVSAFSMGANSAARGYSLNFPRLSGRLDLLEQSLFLGSPDTREEFDSSIERALERLHGDN